MVRPSRLYLLPLAAGSLFVAQAVGAETLYFKNKRTIEAVSYTIKGHLVYIEMTPGRKVYVRKDSIDWEGTERLKGGSISLEKADYALVDAAKDDQEEGSVFTPGKTLTVSDLRRVGSGARSRRAAPRMLVEVQTTAAWTDSGITGRAGQVVSLRASGRATLAPGLDSGPEGTSGKGEPLVPGPYGALLVRVGLSGEPMVVGKALSLTITATGRLYFAINDRKLDDNAGSYSVRVDVPSSVGAGATATHAESALSPEAAAAPSARRGNPANPTEKARSVRQAVENRESEP